MLECDDGNRVSGDGCSKDCKKEAFFKCTPSSNSSTGSDTCVNNEPPGIQGFELFKNLTVVITFTQYVHLDDEKMEDILALTLKNTKEIVVTYNVLPFDSEKFNTLMLQLSFNGSLHGTEVNFWSFECDNN